MPITEAQLRTINEISPRGFHLNRGVPCECGGSEYNTRKKVGYSEYVTFYHRCLSCGNRFETYIEG